MRRYAFYRILSFGSIDGKKFKNMNSTRGNALSMICSIFATIPVWFTSKSPIKRNLIGHMWIGNKIHNQWNEGNNQRNINTFIFFS